MLRQKQYEGGNMIFKGEGLRVNLIESHIAALCFDSINSVNTLNIATLDALYRALVFLKKQKSIHTLLITSDKPSFLLGADITEFLPLFSKPDSELLAWIKKANAIFNQLEDLPFPTISCIKGYALGGGYECALATDFRLADTSAVIGLPETKLGIIPGFGGSVRLPRLIGAENAIECIASGKNYQANNAFKLGMLDGVTEPCDLTSSAITLANQLIKGEIDWKKRRKQKQLPLPLNAVESQMAFSVARALVDKKTPKDYPAPRYAVDAIEKAARYSRKNALEIEHSHFITLAKNTVTPALVSIFLNEKALKAKNKAMAQGEKPINKLTVIGAGIMGGGIAYQAANRGIEVIMQDIAPNALDTGMKEAANLFNKNYEKNKISALEMAKRFAAIKPSHVSESFEKSTLVIEAVSESFELKTRVLAQAEAKMDKGAILATNTSCIPISSLAKGLKRPETFCGMHFFNPVHQMPLVEIIRGEKTHPDTLKQLVYLCAQLGKKAIVVNDCTGFFVNRVLFPYLASFNLLVLEGVEFEKIDTLMQDFGWPMGPAHLIDTIGIDTIYHAQKIMAEGYPDRMGQDPKLNCIELLFKQKRLGCKNQLGFYRYQTNARGKQEKQRDPDTALLLAKLTPTRKASQEYDDDALILRLMIPLINEVIRCLDEKIIETPADADMALIYGLGFPPFRGGVFHYLNTLGLETYLALASPFESLGPLYQIPNSLKEKVQKKESYF